MRQRILTCLLAAWAALSLLPAIVLASGSHEISVQVIGEAHGHVELDRDRADAGDTVWLLAEPEEGYLTRIDGICGSGGLEVRVTYAGLGRYAVTMPDGDVELQIRFDPAGGELYSVTAAVNNSDWGGLTISRTEAREGEYVVIQAVPRPGFMLEQLTALGTDGLPIKGGYVDTRDGIQIYEYCLPNVGVVIEAEFAEDQYSTPGQRALLREPAHSPLRWVTELRFAALLP